MISDFDGSALIWVNGEVFAQAEKAALDDEAFEKRVGDAQAPTAPAG